MFFSCNTYHVWCMSLWVDLQPVYKMLALFSVPLALRKMAWITLLLFAVPGILMHVIHPPCP